MSQIGPSQKKKKTSQPGPGNASPISQCTVKCSPKSQLVTAFPDPAARKAHPDERRLGSVRPEQLRQERRAVLGVVRVGDDGVEHAPALEQRPELLAPQHRAVVYVIPDRGVVVVSLAHRVRPQGLGQILAVQLIGISNDPLYSDMYIARGARKVIFLAAAVGIDWETHSAKAVQLASSWYSSIHSWSRHCAGTHAFSSVS